MYYKLTDREMRTYNGFKWKLGKWYEIPKEDGGGGLCSKSWFHVYDSPLLAVLLNPVHANIKNPRLFTANVRGRIVTDHGLKFGVTKVRLVKEVKLPAVTIAQKVAFGILCIKPVCNDAIFNKWADKWLSGEDRSRWRMRWWRKVEEKAPWLAAVATAESLMDVNAVVRAKNALWSAAKAEALVAKKEALVAKEETWVAKEKAAWSAVIATWTAEEMAVEVAWAVVEVVEAGGGGSGGINLKKIAEEAMKY